ncbi:MAG TPA: hypothetical protein DCP28_28085, partial [Cytophagales bacterium]|nr:hypothetical protein [Cytophagales bacterium]
MKTIGNPIDSQEIIEKYFSDPAKQLTLKKDDLLLEQGEENHRVFYVLKGKLSGYLPDKNLREPVFEATPSSFVGVYSFFSKDHQSYTQVVATEAAVVSYYDGDPWVLQAEESEPFLSFLFRMVVLELRSRQRFAAQMATERQEATNKLIQTEKLATLGQLSAGLAHELNNTIGSLSGNLRQLETDIQQLLMEDKSDRMRSFFMRGLELGQQVSSRQAREARQEWDQERGVPLPVVKKLARANIHPGEVRHGGEAEEAAELWELGYLLHDLQIAAQQAAHVVNSIKSMGISQQSWSHNVDVNQTLNEALTILAHVTKPLTLELELAEELPTLEACHGELVQVWVNLMKNAAESLRQQPV